MSLNSIKTTRVLVLMNNASDRIILRVLASPTTISGHYQCKEFSGTRTCNPCCTVALALKPIKPIAIFQTFET
jgi:hypothetical protein